MRLQRRVVITMVAASALAAVALIYGAGRLLLWLAGL
jgi:hypothetical protein